MSRQTRVIHSFTDLPGAFGSDCGCTSVYAHRAIDGMIFVSFGIGHETVEQRTNPSGWTTVEWVEGRVFEQFGDALDELPTEREREDAPPRVGRLWWRFDTQEVTALSLDPDALSDVEVDEADPEVVA